MTQQTEHNPGAIAPSLEPKLRQFAYRSEPEEQAHLRAMQTDDVAGMFSASLQDKAQRVTDGLTAEEAAQLRLPLQRAGGSAAASHAASGDAQGYLVVNAIIDVSIGLRAPAVQKDTGWHSSTAGSVPPRRD